MCEDFSKIEKNKVCTLYGQRKMSNGLSTINLPNQIPAPFVTQTACFEEQGRLSGETAMNQIHNF